MYETIHKHHKLFISGGIFFVAFLFFVNFMFRQQALKSKAALDDNVNLTFQPNPLIVAPNQDATITVNAKIKTSFSLRGYSFGYTFDKTKVQIKNISYKLGSSSIGLGDDNSTLTQVNTSGILKIMGEIHDATGQVIPANTDIPVVEITLTGKSNDASKMTLGSGDFGFYKINADYSLIKVLVGSEELSINGGLLPSHPAPSGPLTTNSVSGRVVLVNPNDPSARAPACIVNPNAKGVVGLSVTLKGSDGSNKVAQTGADGAYSLSNIPNGKYQLCYGNTMIDKLEQYSWNCTVGGTNQCKDVTINNNESKDNYFYVTDNGNPTEGKVKLNLKVKFQGILSKPKDSFNSMNVKVTLVNDGTNEKNVKTATFTAGDNGIWTGAVGFDIPTTAKYKIFIKGPKHVQKGVCVAAPSETFPGTYQCDKGQISLKDGDNNLDFSGIYQLVGDLPEQDGIVNAFDTSLVLNNIGKSDPETLRFADLNLDGIVNFQDFSLVIAALSVRADDSADNGSGQPVIGN